MVVFPTEVTSPVRLALVVTLPAVRPEAVPVILVPVNAEGTPRSGATRVAFVNVLFVSVSVPAKVAKVPVVGSVTAVVFVAVNVVAKAPEVERSPPRVIDFPVLLVRNSFLLLNAALAEKAIGLGISWVEFFTKNADELVANYLKLNHSEELDFEEEKQLLETLFEKLQTRAAGIDKQISVQIAIDQKAMTEGFQKIQAKFSKSVKQKSDLEVKSIQRVKSMLFPQSHFQERYISYFDGYGINPTALEELIEVANPLDYALKLLKN